MNYYEGDNIGSVLSIDIAFIFDFLSVNPISFKPGRSWLKIPFKEGTGEFTISEEDSDNGVIYSCSGGFYLNRMRGEMDTFMRQYIGSISILRVTDMNGEIYILGDMDAGVTISASGGTGQNFTSENGKAYSYRIDLSHAPYQL